MSSSPREVDPMGDGSCGVYAFLIGAFHIAKNDDSSGFFAKWINLYQACSLNPFDRIDLAEYFLKIQNYTPQELSRSQEIKNLMWTLRQIMYQHIDDNYPGKNLKHHRIYDDFLPFQELLHLVEFYSCSSPTNQQRNDLKVNLLSGSQFFKELAQKIINLAKNDTNKQYKLIYIALREYKQEFLAHYKEILTKKHTWLAELHLQLLANIFNLPCAFQVEKRPLNYRYDGRPFIHFKHVNGNHWRVCLFNSDDYQSKAQELDKAQRDKYQYSINSIKDNAPELYAILQDQLKNLTPYQINYFDGVIDYVDNYARALDNNNPELYIKLWKSRCESKIENETIESRHQLKKAENDYFLDDDKAYHADFTQLTQELKIQMDAHKTKSYGFFGAGIGLTAGLVVGITCPVFIKSLAILIGCASATVAPAIALIIVAAMLLGFIVGRLFEFSPQLLDIRS